MDAFARVLYQKFFLRDVVGKIAPGGVVVLALAQNLETMRTPGLPLGLVLVALFFLIGLVLQVIGELLGLLSASPKPHHLFLLPVGWLQRILPLFTRWWQVNEDATERSVRLLGVSSHQIVPEAFAYWEYLSALREGAGNLAVGLLAAVLLVASENGQFGVLALLGFFVLLAAHKLLAKRQARFEITILARVGLLSVEETRAMGRTMGLREDQIPSAR
ncbi:MAG: hypothetical protein AB7P69_05320 [Candidatus Binatia bacterium]